MADRRPKTESDDPRVSAALAEYLQLVDRGEGVPVAEFLARHPDIANDLRSLLVTSEELAQLMPDSRAPETSTRSMAEQNVETIAPQRIQAASASETVLQRLPDTFGRYRIIRPLGSGAMGDVYLAEDTHLHRQVAIKTPSFDADETGELLERFYREARSAAVVRHSNICPVFDVGEINGRHYISMAYIDGQPLSAYIRPDKLQPERQALVVIRKLALALQEAHDHGIIHRDLKPGNVMIDRKGEPIVMDFGLARPVQSEAGARLTQSGMLVGSPAYMSPEQVEGDTSVLMPATDQYSLGVILYELLTGGLPFRGGITAIIASILTKSPKPPGELRAGLDPRIESLCLKMMAKSPRDRFPSMRAVADAIAAILRSDPARPDDKPKAAGTPQVAAPRSEPKPERAQPAAPAAAAAASITASNVETLYEVAAKCMRKHDYEQVVQMLDGIPEHKRSDQVRALLKKARELSDEVAFLLAEVDEAMRLNDNEALGKHADALLKLKPRHHKAMQIKEELSRYGGGRISKAGGWTPDGRRIGEESGLTRILLIAAAVFGLSLLSVILYLSVGDAVVRVQINHPDVEVGIQDRTLNIKSANQDIKIDPGEDTLKVSFQGAEFETDKFTLNKGENPALVVELLDKTLSAKFGDLSIGEWPVEVQASATPEPETPAVAGASPVEASQAALPVEDASGWTDLFNGRDLTGWTAATRPENWEIRDGAIVGKGTGLSALMSDRTYDDFELEFEYRLAPNSNSGIWFRAPTKTDAGFGGAKTAMSLSLVDDASPVWAKDIQATPGKRTGGLHAVGGPSGTVSAPAGAWNHVVLRAQGTQVSAVFNGVQVLDVNTAEHVARLPEYTGLTRTSGYIGLEDHGDDGVEFRNIRIRKLDTEMADTTGWTDLFNGRDLTGWQPMETTGNNDQHRASQGGWEVRNGELVCTTAKPGWLRSTRQYSDFELHIEFKLKAGSNTDVYVRSPGQGRLSMTGMAIQVIDEHSGKFEMKNPDNRPGAIWGAYGHKTASVTRPLGEWNTLDIRCEGARVQTEINGRQLISADLQAIPDLRNRPRSGFVGLANFLGEADGVAFRNIRIREIVPTVADNAGWTDLLNGKNLAGWHTAGDASWTVNNGVLAGAPGEGWIATDREFSDFELQLEYRLSSGANSGIFLRIPEQGPLGGNDFVEVQLIDDRIPDVNEAWKRTGAVWAVQGPATPVNAPIGQWHPLTIRAVGPEITISIAGNEVNKVNLATAPVLGPPKRDLHRPRGHIGFQHRLKPVEFRNIRIRDLAATTADADGGVPDGRYQVLFNKDQGWRYTYLIDADKFVRETVEILGSGNGPQPLTEGRGTLEQLDGGKVRFVYEPGTWNGSPPTEVWTSKGDGTYSSEYWHPAEKYTEKKPPNLQGTVTAGAGENSASQQSPALPRNQWIDLDPSAESATSWNHGPPIYNQQNKVWANEILTLDNAAVAYNHVQARDVSIKARVKMIEGQNIALVVRSQHGVGGIYAYIDRVDKERVRVAFLNTKHERTLKVEDEFEYEITAVGNHATIKIDDKTVLEDPNVKIMRFGHVETNAYRARGTFRKIQVKILDK